MTIRGPFECEICGEPRTLHDLDAPAGCMRLLAAERQAIASATAALGRRLERIEQYLLNQLREQRDDNAD